MFTKAVVLLIKGYQYFLSPYLGTACRFEPSCSNYTMRALLQHGVVKGATLGILRILKCQPWHSGGEDPVPDQFDFFFIIQPYKEKFKLWINKK